MKSKKIKQLVATVMIATTVAATVPDTINSMAAFAISDITYPNEAAAQAWGFQVTLINSNTEYRIDGYTGTSTNITIPSQINGKNVTVIGDSVFLIRTI